MISKLFRSVGGQLLLTGALCVAVSLVPYLAVSGVQAMRGHSIAADNVVTTGRVVTVGQSTVTNGPSMIGFGYKVPGNTHQPWSYEREQKVDPAVLKGFRVGQSVPIEYSRAIPGMARLRGFGRTSSVYGDETIENVMLLLRFLLPMQILIFLMQWGINRWRQNRQPKSQISPANS